MSQMTAFCGLRCDRCETFIATRDNDDVRRREIAAKWSQQFGSDFRPEQMSCLGCRSEGGPLFAYCSACMIRKCALERGVPTCAHCEDFGCEPLRRFFEMSPEGKRTLEELRKTV